MLTTSGGKDMVTLLGGRRKQCPPRCSEAEAFSWHMPGSPPLAPSPTEGCWDWTSATDGRGYGMFRMNSQRVGAHQASYRIYHGPIENGLFVLHSCDRPICVQPAHLHLGTHTLNMRECIKRKRNAFGERNGQSRLTEVEVEWIRQAPLKVGDMARMLDINHATISDIRQRRTWNHI